MELLNFYSNDGILLNNSLEKIEVTVKYGGNDIVDFPERFKGHLITCVSLWESIIFGSFFVRSG